MKRILLAAGVVATFAAAWATYPPRAHASQAADGGYALLTGRITFVGFGAKGMLTTTMPDGQIQTQEVEVKTGTHSSINNSLEQVHLSEVRKLNELRVAGWRVKTATQVSGAVGGIFYETAYLLEKE